MRWPSLKQSLALIALGATLSVSVQADVLMIEVIEQRPPNSADGLERPKRMMTMEQVEAHFGAPDTRHETVGDPPITRWDYADYSVYFEYQWVLETVVRREGELLAADTVDNTAH